MSVNETFDGYYADTAYSPDQRRQWEEANPERDKIFGSRLSWDRKTRDIGAEDEYDFNNLAIAENWETQRNEKRVEGEDTFRALKVRYDQQAIMPPNYKFTAVILYMAAAFGKVFLLVSYILLLPCCSCFLVSF